MIRPVVSLCRMAMNESIATTCCYKRVSDNIAEMAVTLHGGKIVKRPFDTRYFFPGGKGEIPGMWLNKSIQIYPTSLADAEAVSSVWQNAEGAWWVYYDGDDVRVTDNLGNIINFDEKGEPVLIPRKFRKGNIIEKRYYTRDTTYRIMHVGSTSPHYKYTSGNDWLPDHAAVQYSS